MNRKIQTSLTAACALALGFTVATAQRMSQTAMSYPHQLHRPPMT